MNRIVEVIKNNNACGNHVTVRDIVSGIIPRPAIQSDGGIFVESIIKRNKNVGIIISVMGVVIAYYLSFTKLLMGILNAKPVSNLVAAMITAGIVFVGPIVLCCVCVGYGALKGAVVKRIVADRVSVRNFGHFLDNYNVGNEEASVEECVGILREYALKNRKPTTVNNGAHVMGPSFSAEVFAAVSTAQLAAAAAAAGSSASASAAAQNF